ncbi:MAG: hypothetical protein GXO61_05235 [Epsilonproteobacteria bacterium]|nr:hypothetical protein [Campylobacterota bacterium]
MAVVKRYNPEMLPTKRFGLFLYLFLIPPLISILFALVTLNIKGFFLNLFSFLLYLLAFYFSKKGFAQEFEYQNSTFAKAPKIPYKLFGAFTLAVAVFYSSLFLAKQNILESLFLGAIAFTGYYLWYGFDPAKDKIPNTGDVSVELALKTLKEAKEKIAKTQQLRYKIKNYELRKRVGETLKKANAVVKELEKKPMYIRDLRKFLVVFLDSVYDVTNSYVKVEESLKPGQKEALYHLMDDVEKRFNKELERVKAKGTFEYEVKLETLDTQIKE